MRKAFSLVELSIVIVIIALLISAVMGGGKILEASKTKKLITEIKFYKNAIEVFKTTYGQYPGDISNATSFWGSSGLQDGDGSGIIDWRNDNTVFEHANLSIHLEKAGLIPDHGYTTGNGGGSYPLESYIGYMRVMYSQATNGFRHVGYNYLFQNAHMLLLGKDGVTNEAFLKPEGAYRLDTKLDDGKPKSGIMTFRVANNVTDASCTNSSTSYYIESTSLGCNVVLELDRL